MKLAGVSVSPTNDVVVETPVSCEPSTAGNLPEPSSCTILFAVVPTSTAIVHDAVIVPPVKPVPATTLVTVPVPDDEAINDEPLWAMADPEVHKR